MNQFNLEQTRYSLLSRLKDWEDQDSWMEFFNNYWRLIHGVAVKAGLSREEAEDVVQETVLTVAKNIGDFRVNRQKGSFKAWLMHTTRWRIADQFRKRKRLVEVAAGNVGDLAKPDGVEAWADQGDGDIEANWDREWEQNLLQRALEKIRHRVEPERYQAFDLHVLKQWPVSRVAETLGMTQGQVYFAKTKISRLLEAEIQLLKDKLD